MKNMKVSISAGNSKMGAIPSVSLPPIVTCPAGCPCAAKCYAAKLCRLRRTVREAYARNLEILREAPGVYWTQVRAAAMISRYFRYHVSGDIPDAEYFAEMVRAAQEIPGTRFLAFTKRYQIVNDYLDQHDGDLPGNLVIVFSEWTPDWAVPNPYNLPVARVIFKGETAPEDLKMCGGNCMECACRGIGCWELHRGEALCLPEH